MDAGSELDALTTLNMVGLFCNTGNPLGSTHRPISEGRAQGMSRWRLCFRSPLGQSPHPLTQSVDGIQELRDEDTERAAIIGEAYPTAWDRVLDGEGSQ